MLFPDIEAPVFDSDCSNITEETTPGASTAVVEWDTPSVTDNSVGVISVSCSPESGTTFNLDETVVTCDVSDSSDNTANCSFVVKIVGTYLNCCPFL